MVLQVHKEIGRKVMLLILYVIAVDLLLCACSSKEPQNQKTPEKIRNENSSIVNRQKEWKLPILIPNGEFLKLAGWFSESELLYITHLKKTAFVYRYQLLSGKSELLYKSDFPISSVQLSSSKKDLLIQASPSATQGQITIIDLKGTVLYQRSFPSYELAFEWDPYDQSKLLVSAFKEDWTYQLFLITLKTARTTEVSLPQPFVKWIGKDEIAYINWNKDNPTFFAPLVKENLNNDKNHIILPSVYQFTAYRNLLLTITVNEKDSSRASYTFYNSMLKPIADFSIPQLSNYSGWIVPFYDYNENSRQFITFSPLESTVADSYTEGYNLVNYDVKNNKQTIVMKGLENKPISLSPLGDMCLYGSNFEKLINLKTKTITTLVKE